MTQKYVKSGVSREKKSPQEIRGSSYFGGRVWGAYEYGKQMYLLILTVQNEILEQTER